MMKTRNRNLRCSDIDMTQLELDRLIMHFGQSNKAEGKSPKTITWYTEMLSNYAGFLRK